MIVAGTVVETLNWKVVNDSQESDLAQQAAKWQKLGG